MRKYEENIGRVFPLCPRPEIRTKAFQAFLLHTAEFSEFPKKQSCSFQLFPNLHHSHTQPHTYTQCQYHLKLTAREEGSENTNKRLENSDYRTVILEKRKLHDISYLTKPFITLIKYKQDLTSSRVQAHHICRRLLGIGNL